MTIMDGIVYFSWFQGITNNCDFHIGTFKCSGKVFLGSEANRQNYIINHKFFFFPNRSTAIAPLLVRASNL